MALWLADNPLVLASKSDVRRSVLEAAGLPVEITPASIDERSIENNAAASDPKVVAKLLAREKAKAIATKMPRRLVLGADQTLALGKERFSKPAGRDAARAQLLKWRRAVRGLRGGTADHAEFLGRLSRPLSGCGRILGEPERRRLSARENRHPVVRKNRRRSFHHFGHAVIFAAAVPART
jgi:hypothetical protein